MRIHRLPASVAVAGLAVPLLVAATSAPSSGSGAAAACDPFTAPAYAGNVPTPTEVLGFELGSQEVTSDEAEQYLRAVADASPRVKDGVMAVSGQGRELWYAVVGAPSDVRAAQAAAAALRDPNTPPERAARIAERAPAIAWVAGNVHGNEESGADAALQVLRDLADRTDCAASQVREGVVTVIVPTQNPDGRELDYRRNAYGFDMNRDWFARTQSETDGKLELLRAYPSVLFIDDHEMGAYDFFFPPNADPVHHEIADRSISWINDLYGAAMQQEFTEQDIPFFNYDIYDLLYMGYGDTVPTTGFLGAGMTFEKNNADPIEDRVHEQYVAVWTSLSALAGRKSAVLKGWAASYRQAYQQGVRGKLEPNAVFAPGSVLEQQVPDERIRSYFIPRSKAKAAEVRDLIRRLQRMDVEVRVLTAPLRVPDYRAYGAARDRSVRLPVGTYYVPMAQAQKHWIQAMLGEDSYVPFPYFYDVTAWSLPMLYNVDGGRSGVVLDPRSRRAPLLSAAGSPGQGARQPEVGIWLLDPDSTSAYESEGWMRWLYEHKWKLPYTGVTSDAIGTGALDGLDVLVTPGGDSEAAYELLGESGRAALEQWVADGGRFVGMRGGTEIAALLGLTTATLAEPTSDVPGSLIRAKVDPGPLKRGVGDTVWSFFEYDWVMTVADRDSAVVRFPSTNSPAWFISGYASGAEELAGTAVAVDERYGDGRVVVFASDPNFRGFTDGLQKILWNAVYGNNPPAAPVPHARVERREAAQAARQLAPYQGRMIVTVRAAAASKAADLIAAYDVEPRVERIRGGLTRYVLDTGPAEESPYARSLASDLVDLGRRVVAVRLP